MSLVVVLYDGQRRVVKVSSPNTLIQNILSEACSAFGIKDTTLFALRHKRSLLDASQPFRFSNISNNAQLDLVCTSDDKNKASVVNKNSTCRIALTIEGSSVTVTENFKSCCTMAEMIVHLVNANKLPDDVMSRSPEIVYMRNKYSGEQELNSRTFSSLGLAGQSARLQLRYDTDGLLSDQQIIPRCRSAEFVESSSGNEQLQLTMTLPLSAAPYHSAANGRLTVEQDTDIRPLVVPMQELQKASSNETLDECLSRMLERNFDAVTTPAVITLSKYLVNILENPTVPKYRSINTLNKAFQDKISRAQGALDFLLMLRFTLVDGCLVLEQFEESQLRRALDLLVGVMDSLEISPSDRPVLRKHRTVHLIEAAFDPFKASVLRTAPQPVRSGADTISNESLSSTEIQLMQLQKRRLELEGDPMGIDRSPLVVFPCQEAAAPDKTEVRSSEEDVDLEGSSAISRSVLLRVAAHARSDSDGPPLTTQAVRDLQKAQRERVYSRTLIKIKFPDRVCLQGYFHPRNNVDDLYRWLVTCLRDEYSWAVPGQYSFELYLSPPRTVLPHSGEKSGHSSTLAELQLMPAAVIHLAWKVDADKALNVCLGNYLRQHLVEMSSELQRGDDDSATRPLEYPQSQPLIQSTSDVMDVSQPMDAPGKGDDAHTSATDKSHRKPKWFK